MNQIIQGDAFAVLETLPDRSVQMCITSPPYWRLRDYGVHGQLGLERTPENYVERLVNVFHEARRVLRDNGTLWINIGDTYVRKNLMGIPWRLALALQADGWLLRQDLIWHKPNPIPESPKDRCTRAHEYLFLLASAPCYHYDADAIREAHVSGTHSRGSGGNKRGVSTSFHESGAGPKAGGWNDLPATRHPLGRNKRSVWTVAPRPYKGAHFATFPPSLVRPCILAGARSGDTVLDPFLGSGTTAVVAKELGRTYLGVELNPEYIRLAEQRLHSDAPARVRVRDAA